MKVPIVMLFLALQGFALFAKQAQGADSSPAFSSDPELEKGYNLLYEQKFPEAREIFQKWIDQNPTEPFGEVSLAASYLFEEFYLQHVLTSEYFLDDKRFLGGIQGTPDPERMKGFEQSVTKARKLAFQKLKVSPRDPEALYSLVLAAGMQSDADSMLPNVTTRP